MIVTRKYAQPFPEDLRVRGYDHLLHLLKNKKSVIYLVKWNICGHHEYNIMPVSWFINSHYSWVNSRLMDGVYIYNKKQLNGL